MTRILGVHGVHQYKNGDPPLHGNQRIAATWRAALATHRLDRHVDLQVAYYADLVRSDAQDTDLHSANPDEQDLINQLLNAWATAWGITSDGDQGPIALPARILLGKIAERANTDRDLVARAARRIFPEVARYLDYADNHPRRHKVRNRVAQAIAAHQPDIVIAHSLGTVVAYETLHAHPHQHIPLLITLGSPLALPGAIFDRLDPTPRQGRGQRPPGVHRWIDIADTGDLIAIPRGAIPHRFTGVDEHHDVTIGNIAMHDATRYLTHPKLAVLLERFDNDSR